MTALQEVNPEQIVEAEPIDIAAAERERQLQPFRDIITVVDEAAAADHKRSEQGQDPQLFSTRAKAVLGHAKTSLRTFHADPSKVHSADVYRLAEDAVSDTDSALELAKKKINALDRMEGLFMRALPYAVEDQAYNNRAAHTRSAQRSITTGERNVSDILRNVTEQIVGLQESDIAVFSSLHELAAISPELKELVAILKAFRTRDLNDHAQVEEAKMAIRRLDERLKEKQAEIDREKANLGVILLQDGAGTDRASESLNQQAKLEEERRTLQDEKDKAILRKHEAETDIEAVRDESKEPGEKMISSRRAATQYVLDGVAALIPTHRFEESDLQFYGSTATPSVVEEGLNIYRKKLSELQLICEQSKDEKRFSNDRAVEMVDLAEEVFLMHGVHLNALRQTLLAAAHQGTLDAIETTMDQVAKTEDTSLSAHTSILHSESEVIASIRGELAGIRELYVAEQAELVAAREELVTALLAYKLGGMSLRASLEQQQSIEAGIERVKAGKNELAKKHHRMVRFGKANEHIDLSALGAGDEAKIFDATFAESLGIAVRAGVAGERIAKQIGASAYGAILSNSNEVLKAREDATVQEYTAYKGLSSELARAILSASAAGVEQAQLATARFLGMGKLFSQTAETVVDLPGVALIDLVSKRYLNEAAQAVLADATGEGKPLSTRIAIAGRVVRGRPLTARITSNSGPHEVLAITTAARNGGLKRQVKG